VLKTQIRITRPQCVKILSLSKALASLRHIYLGSFFLDPEDIRKLSIGAIYLGSLFLDPEDIRELGMGAICNFPKGTGLL